MDSNFCPNKFPTLRTEVPYRIALIGESPGADEVVRKEPFVGASGRLLDYLLNRAGIMRAACYLGNVAQHRPPSNDITRFAWTGPEITDGLRQLTLDITEFRPHLCVLLGGSALRSAKSSPDSITKWRGSLFTGAYGSPFAGRKCLGTYHPASALRVYEQTPLLLFDLKRAKDEGQSAKLVLPERRITVATAVEEVEQYFHEHTTGRHGSDIEGYVNNLTCISFSSSPSDAFVIPFTAAGTPNYWSEQNELRVWLAIKRFLESTHTEIIWQNGLYDRFVLAYTYGIVPTRNHDTMVKHWELFCELEKKLSLQASIYTKEPFWKDEREDDDQITRWQYCGKDSAVTLEISNRQDSMLIGQSMNHAMFNEAMEDPLLYMELRGIRYDAVKAAQRVQEVKAELFGLQHTLNKAVGKSLNITDLRQALTLMRSVFCFKRSANSVTTLDAVLPNCKKAYIDAATRALQLCVGGFPFDDSRNGEFSMLLDLHLNTQSFQQLCHFLYTTLCLPLQVDKKTKQPTADALALLVLFKKTENPVLKLVLRTTKLLTQLETLETKCDPDGRIRCSYNVVGTVTGRLSCSKSPTRTGYNLQTVTKDHRDLFLADEKYWFFQCDLSGADGWTVAARCAQLGDSTMLDDLRAGLKPAKIIALMYLGGGVNLLSRDQIAEQSKQITDKLPNNWIYMAGKRVFHGSNYLMGKLTMSNQILEDSWKYGAEPTFVEPAICGNLQALYFQRYPGVPVYHRWHTEQLRNKRQITSACGHTRIFMGRPNSHDTLKEACAHEPQINTTYFTNRAALNLWNDLANRKADGLFIVEPLHQIHDALVGQFPKEQTPWALDKLRGWFKNSLTIAGQVIKIPFEGHYGRSWSPKDLIYPI